MKASAGMTTSTGGGGSLGSGKGDGVSWKKNRFFHSGVHTRKSVSEAEEEA